MARAASAASLLIRELMRRFSSGLMRVLHRRGVVPLGEPGGTVHAGLGSEGTLLAPPDAAKVRGSRFLMGLRR